MTAGSLDTQVPLSWLYYANGDPAQEGLSFISQQLAIPHTLGRTSGT